jgi:hypothetical protein
VLRSYAKNASALVVCAERHDALREFYDSVIAGLAGR